MKPSHNQISGVSKVVSINLIRHVVSKYPLNPRGTHGTSHWMRVKQNGMILSEETGANRNVVELFALFHDSRREREGYDEDHGRRGAEFAHKLWKMRYFQLSSREFDLLHEACSWHTGGGNSPDDVTVATCWDADRLDLARVGIAPSADRLCTGAARNPEMIRWAVERSERWVEKQW